MKKITLNIKGMHCKSCAALIEDALEDVEGIKNSTVSNEKENAIIEFDESKVDEKKIKKAITEEGYTVE